MPEARIDWRPSRWLSCLLLVIGILAALSLLASELPAWAAWPAALVALAHGGRLAARELRRPPCRFVFRGEAAPATVDGEPADDLVLEWRGPLVFARWRDRQGRIRRLSWWPDTLSPARRRELRLAAPAPRAARRLASVAP